MTFEICDGCRKRAEVFPKQLGTRIFHICEICYAKISICETRYPEVYRKYKEGTLSRYDAPSITSDELYAEVLRLRDVRKNLVAGRDKDGNQYYGTSCFNGQGNEMRPFDDITPLHPIPLLGFQKPPDCLPPQVADNPKLCVLDAGDRLRLHGMKVCWTDGDSGDLPQPKPEAYNALEGDHVKR